MITNTINQGRFSRTLVTLTTFYVLASQAFAQDFGDIGEKVGNPVWKVLTVVIVVGLLGEFITLGIGLFKEKWGLVVSMLVAIVITGSAGWILKQVYDNIKDSPF